VTKHDPFVYFDSITGDNGTGVPSSYCDSHIVSLDQFWTDLQAGALPNYSFITPNICDDAHSCRLSTGDAWLSTTIPRITNSSEFSSTAVFITYDEGSTNASATGAPGGGKVVCIAVSPYAKHGYVSDVPYSHYSLLATVEAIFGLGSLGRNDLGASPMSDLFTTGIP
jgi:phosphatidylinositol-3-phosphatase